MIIISKGEFPIKTFIQLKQYFDLSYFDDGVVLHYEDKEFRFIFDKDFTKDIFPTDAECYIGDGTDFLQNKMANSAKISISLTCSSGYYDFVNPVRNGGDLFKMVVLLLARLYGDSEEGFSERLYNFCEKSLEMNFRFYKKFDKEKYEHYKNAYLFFRDYFNQLIEY